MLVTAQRIHTLHMIRLSRIPVHDKGCTIQTVDTLKHSRPGHHQLALELQRFEQDQKLCVVNCLPEYIQKTRTVRNHTDQLLICYTKPFGPASKDSIARWLKSVLLAAGIQNFPPHSFIKAAASSMFNSGSSVDDILKSARWSKTSTFYKFYKRNPTQMDIETATSEGRKWPTKCASLPLFKC